MKKEQCHRCHGSGVLTKVCRKCNGTKFYNGCVCSLCRGSGTYVFMKNQRRKEEVPCPTCKGEGTIVKRGLQKSQRSYNPLISHGKAREMKDQMKV